MSGNMSIPAPIVFSPSQRWDGNDGSWSTFIFRLGTPAQTFRLLPSTAWQQILVPVPEGCTPSDPPNCGDLRGAFPYQGKQIGFQYNESSTWAPIGSGLYDLVVENHLNYNGNGLFGFETVGLMVDGDLVFPSQVVAGIATKDFYIGVFGLGPKPSNFSDFENPQRSLMGTLKDEEKIPSLSFAYTAGASYRIPKALASLTLGGYDQSRFTPPTNPVTFPFNVDDSRPLSVGIQGISASNTLRGTVTLSSSSSPFVAVIDSTVSHLWFPRSVCDVFEDAFGLTYDNHTNLYLFSNASAYNKLVSNSPSIVIVLGNENNPSTQVHINLPFGSFDLKASHPIYMNATPYFPIRRAENETQYTLGRAFLQEAYVIADYERSNFSVHQTVFQTQAGGKTDIVPIFSPDSQNNETSQNPAPTSNKANGGLSVGAIVGIVVGVIGAIAIIAAILYIRRRKQIKSSEPMELEGSQPHTNPTVDAHKEGGEIMGDPKFEMADVVDPVRNIAGKVIEIGVSDRIPTPDTDSGGVELDSSALVLLSDDAARRYELP